ncbi:MAG TPA: homoserine dehydrogenase [Pyrinomonadaceae bacterium]|nr:homoserine dehydrogenase [Pyrinomonadaceae bacterium]
MQSEKRIIVLKFGSSVLRNENDLPAAVHEIYRWWRDGFQVVAVVSALGDTTDELNRRAHVACDQPNDELVAALLATGEAASSALLGLALNRSGIPATVLDAEQAGLTTDGPVLDANLTSVDTASVLKALSDGVVVLPGFVGRGRSGKTTLLGRGGSDLTAMFLAQRLGAGCRLIKDVDGLYTSDPNTRSGSSAARFVRVSYATAARVGGAVVQLKAIDFAEHHRLRFTVSSVGSGRATEVGPHADSVALSDAQLKPLRVALLGCGTVGGGVFQRLAALPGIFDVVGVGTRSVEHAIGADVPVRLITTRLEALIAEPVDVVIELLGGEDPARTLVSKALRLGNHVVTANKALLANDLEKLQSLGANSGATIRYSAAVGGVMPALETVSRARSVAPLRSISGVLNGTTNFILDQLASGSDFAEAVLAAQRNGYAERDPQADLNGTDIAQKLILLAHAAFDIPLSSIQKQGIENVNPKEVRETRKNGRVTRLVAECRREAHGFVASVSPVELPFDHPLARVRGVENRLIIQSQNGRTWEVCGRGAGRWPTTEAVIGDLFDLWRESVVEVEQECVA